MEVKIHSGSCSNHSFQYPCHFSSLQTNNSTHHQFTMSASKNPDAMTNAQGEFSSRVPPSEPLTTKGHAPGVKVGNDRYPEFSAETYPPGTAPKENTHLPQPSNEFVGQGLTAASDTFVGSSSADVHQGYGVPGSGQTSQELHGRGKKERSGLEGVGANASDPQHQYHHDRDYETGKRGVSGGDPDNFRAELQNPVSAEEIASERR